MLSLKVTGLTQMTKKLEKFNGRVGKAIGIALRQSARDVVTLAKKNHRYISRTGNLTRSIKWDRVGKFQVDMFIDDVDAIYGKWQHDGSEFIRNDKFLKRPWQTRGKQFKKRFFNRFEGKK